MIQGVFIDTECALNDNITSDAKFVFWLIKKLDHRLVPFTLDDEAIAHRLNFPIDVVKKSIDSLITEGLIKLKTNGNIRYLETDNNSYWQYDRPRYEEVYDRMGFNEHYWLIKKAEDEIQLDKIKNKYISNYSDILPIRDEFKLFNGRVGCYLFYNHNGELVYIGQSRDLGSRMFTSMKKRAAYYYSFIIFNENNEWYNELDTFEYCLINYLKPKENVIKFDIYDAYMEEVIKYYNNVELVRRPCFKKKGE